MIFMIPEKAEIFIGVTFLTSPKHLTRKAKNMDETGSILSLGTRLARVKRLVRKCCL